MEQWMWVSDGQTQVDTSELISAAVQMSDALAAARRAAMVLWEVGHQVGLGGAWPDGSMGAVTTPLGVELEEQVAVAQVQLVQVRQDLQQFTILSDRHAEWLSQAALVYAGAEAGVEGYAAACASLTSLGCDFPAGQGLGARFGAGMALLGALPAMVGQFQSNGGPVNGTVPSGGVEAQAHLLSVTGTTTGFHSSVVTIARWWKSLGDFFSGRGGGVVVADQTGNAVWGSPATLAVGAPVAIPSHPAGTTEDAVVRARSRLDSAVLKRGSEEDVLAAALGSGGQVSPMMPYVPDTKVATPLTASALLARIAISGSSPSVGEVQILRHRIAPPPSAAVKGRGGGSHQSDPPRYSWSVVVRGTQEWLPGSNNPQDMQSNLEVVAGRNSDQTAAVQLAMHLADIGPGEPVEFVGHSQGGAIALDLAGNKQVKEKYNVVSVLTAGAPTAGVGADVDVPVLNLENLSDIVPSLDGAPADAGKERVTVLFDPRALPGSSQGNAHSLRTYAAAATQIDSEAATNPMASEVAKWSQSRVTSLDLDNVESSEAFYFRTSRAR